MSVFLTTLDVMFPNVIWEKTFDFSKAHYM